MAKELLVRKELTASAVYNCMNVRNRMRQSLEQGLFDNLDEVTKEEIVESLYIYHEELLFQNDELKESNQRILKLERQSDALFSNAPVGLTILDKNMAVLKLNAMMKKILPEIELKSKLTRFLSEESQDDFYFFNRGLKKIEDEEIIQSDLILLSGTHVSISGQLMTFNDQLCYYVSMTPKDRE